jgi:hypothetical protein
MVDSTSMMPIDSTGWEREPPRRGWISIMENDIDRRTAAPPHRRTAVTSWEMGQNQSVHRHDSRTSTDQNFLSRIETVTVTVTVTAYAV